LKILFENLNSTQSQTLVSAVASLSALPTARDPSNNAYCFSAITLGQSWRIFLE